MLRITIAVTKTHFNVLAPLGEPLARFLLTPRKVDTLRAPATETLVADGHGLYLLNRSTGKSWLYIYSSPTAKGSNGKGKRRKMALGSYPEISLAEARIAAEAPQGLVARGIDPLDARDAGRQQVSLDARLSALDAAPVTVKDLFLRWREGYLAHHRSDGGTTAQGQFDRYVFPIIGELPLSVLRRRYITAVLQGAKDSGVKRTCGVLLSDMRQMFEFAIESEWLAGDPSAGIKKASWDGASKKGERVLAEKEIQELAKKLVLSDLTPRLQAAIWLLISTAKRIEETVLAELSHINTQESSWLIPAANQKKVVGEGNKDHLVWLSDFAREQVEQLMTLAKADAEERAVVARWLFPAKRSSSGHVNEKTLTHATGDRQKPGGTPQKGRTRHVDALVLGGGHWSPHDLRRTAATMKQELGVPPNVIKLCLNQATGDAIEQTYQRGAMSAQVKEARTLLGEKLAKLKAAGEADALRLKKGAA
jgi:integrase